MQRTLSLIISVLSLIILTPYAHSSERALSGWQLIEQGALIVDVRTPAEFSDGHLNGALNYPLNDIDTHFTHIDKNQPVVLYCRSGNRSGQAYRFLTAQGFTNLHNAGGLNELLSTQPKQD